MQDQPSALLWDNDGVLVDTEGLYYQATREVLATVGVTLTEAQYVELFLRQGTGAWHFALAAGESEARVAQLKAARNARYTQLLAAAQDLTLPGARAAVSALAQRYRMAVVTTSAPDHFERIHRSTDLLGYFEFCLTRGDYARSKPHPDPYLLALERIGLPAERCLVIEDSERGAQAAAAAGLRVWVVPSHFTRGLAFKDAERVFDDIGTLASALLDGE